MKQDTLYLVKRLVTSIAVSLQSQLGDGISDGMHTHRQHPRHAGQAFPARLNIIARYVVLKDEVESIHLSLLLLQPEFRNQGIGERVMQTLMSRAAESSQPLTLSCFLGNQPAMTFYRKIGFCVVTKDEHFVTFRSPTFS